MDRTLIADDGSAAALRAIEVAVDLAKKTGAELSAIAVVDPGEYRQTEITAFAQSEALEAGEALDPIIDEAAAYVDRCRTIAASRCVSRDQIEKRSGSRGRHSPAGLILRSVFEAACTADSTSRRRADRCEPR
jgi:nucleotide-binding universal stress UspA family protein